MPGYGEICPDAWLINFTNPSGIITTTVTKHSHAKCIGLCNVPINMERAIARILDVDPARVYCRFVGLNQECLFGGQRYHTGIARKITGNHSAANNILGITWSAEFISALKLFPSPYLKFFYRRVAMLEEEINAMKEGHTRATDVMAIEATLFQLYRDTNLREKPEQLSQRGGTYYSEIAISLIDSIYNNRSKIHVVNTVNNGAISTLPYDSIVKTNCVINNTGAHPLVSSPLPLEIQGLVAQVKAYEELTVAAAIHKSKAMALTALVNHSLVQDAAIAKSLIDRIVAAHPTHIQHFA